MFRVYFVSETAKVELESGRVYAPGVGLYATRAFPEAGTEILLEKPLLLVPRQGLADIARHVIGCHVTQ
jgi:hypothetical protein